jgi:signal transduction histidine kinase
VRRELKLVILVFLLVVGPAVVLSFLAGRVLGNWQVIFQKRMETEAAKTLENVAANWAERLDELRRGLQDDLARYPPDVCAATYALSNAWIAGLFVYEQGKLSYPPRDEIEITFTPRHETAPHDDSGLPHVGAGDGVATNPTWAIREYRQVLEHPGLSADLANRTRLHLARLYRKAGQVEDALTNLAVVARFPGLPSALPESLSSSHAVFARDPEEGFYYDLIALQEMSRLFAETGISGVRQVDLELMRRGLQRYADLAPLQREQVMSYLADSIAKHDYAAGDEDPRILARWHERVRGRRLEKAFRDKVEQELFRVLASEPGLAGGWVRGRIGTNEFLLTSGSPESPTSRVERVIAVQLDSTAVRQTLDQLGDSAGNAAGLTIRYEVAGSSGRSAGTTRPDATSARDGPLLAERRLTAPLERVTSMAYPADSRAFSANVRLQARLYGWGGLVLLCSVVVGGWLVWREAANEIRAARERSEFAAAVSHDLRTPLSSMRMLAESLYLGRIQDEDKRQRFLGTILKESDRLSRLTDRALYFIRFGQGALRYRFTEGDLAGLVRDVVETFATGIGGRIIERETDNGGRGREALRRLPLSLNDGSVGEQGGGNEEWTITLTISRDLPPVCFDAGAMEQVVFNLLDNAAKYSRNDRRIEVEVAWEPRRGQVLIVVTDHGMGITPTDLRRIFRAYQRGGGSVNTAGLGLGLALCQDIVKAHRGRIQVKSEVGCGSTFTVVLPGCGNCSGASTGKVAKEGRYA